MRRHLGRLIVYPLAVALAVGLCVGWWLAARDRRAEAQLGMAWNLVGMRVYDEAVGHAEQSLAIRPEDPRAWLARGLALYGRAGEERRAGDAVAAEASGAMALAAIDGALARGSGRRPFLVEAASLLLQQGVSGRAFTAADQALALGRDAEALWLRAMARLQGVATADEATVAAARAAAHADCTDALALAPDAVAVAHVALSAVDHGDDTLLGPAAERIGQLSPADPVGPYLRALEAERAKRWGDAERDYGRALDLLGAFERRVAPASAAELERRRKLAADLYAGRARARAALERPAEAAADWDQALRLVSNWAEANQQAAGTYVRCGRIADAEAALLRAWRQGSTDRREEIRSQVESGQWDALPNDGVLAVITAAAEGH